MKLDRVQNQIDLGKCFAVQVGKRKEQTAVADI